MSQYLGVSVALIVFMGLVSGGMFTLVLMTTRKHQTNFSLILALSGLLALAGVFAAVADVDKLHEGLANALVILVLSFALGYTLTTFSVLSYSTRNKPLSSGNAASDGRTAVILLSPGEPPQYEVKNASRRLALADDPQDVPPVLLRPFYLRDLKSKYAAIGDSPYRDYHVKLAEKVQSRLDASHHVYTAFYSDHPNLADAIREAADIGEKRIILVHTRVSNPPDPVMHGDLLEGLNLEGYGVKLAQAGPLWDSDLLPQIYVRRVLEAVPQVDANPEAIGLLLIGRGHPTNFRSRNADFGMAKGEYPQSAIRNPHSKAPSTRQSQEQNFQNKIRQALLKVGFDNSKVMCAWLRWQRPTVVEGLNALIADGCKTVLWMPSTFPADGVSTLYDISTLLAPLATSKDVRLAALGAWNADDLAAEDIAARVRAVSGPSSRPAVARVR